MDGSVTSRAMLSPMTSLAWQPTATVASLQLRAALLAKIRAFFAERHVLEVETPLLSQHTVTDPYVIGIPALYQPLGAPQSTELYLQTSPEYAMKRLLAANCGAIYQISKAFRQGEVGRVHNPEFTMLEWYRPGFDHLQLMDEMDALLQAVLNTEPAERLRYADAFTRHLGIDPHRATVAELIACVQEQQIELDSSVVDGGEHSRNGWLDILMTHAIEPQIGQERPVLLYDFPSSQAALAKIRAEDPPVASRFEVYFKGYELANGFHELQDAAEQAQRFERDLAYRKAHGIAPVTVDERFLAALQSGIPDCAGVALGVDRLCMLAMGLSSVAEVMSFAISRA